VNISEEKSEDFFPSAVQEFGLRANCPLTPSPTCRHKTNSDRPAGLLVRTLLQYKSSVVFTSMI
jgi:hypothetical protein